jgi:sugar phosphate isomerase/epimerase
MKLALSGRLWETGGGYTANFREQIEIAAELGYDGVEMRYPLVPARGEWDDVRAALRQARLELVFAPAAALPTTDEKKADLLRVLDALQFLGGRYLKLLPKSEDELDAMRLTAELASERGIQLVSQLHANTLTDTIARTRSTLEALAGSNVGLIFDACHIPFVEEAGIAEAVQRLAPWIKIVNLQSYKPARADDGLGHIDINGREWSLALPGDAQGTDLAEAVRQTQQSGFDGWYVAMPAVDASMQPLDVARAYKQFFDGLA